MKGIRMDKTYPIELLDKNINVYFKDNYRVLPPGHFVKVNNDPEWHEVIYDPKTDTASANGKSLTECKVMDRKHKSVPTHSMVASYFNRREIGDTHDEAVTYAEYYAPFTPRHVVEYYIRYYYTSMITNWFDVKKEQSNELTNPPFYYYKNKSEKVRVDSESYSTIFSKEQLSSGIQLSLF